LKITCFVPSGCSVVSQGLSVVSQGLSVASQPQDAVALHALSLVSQGLSVASQPQDAVASILLGVNALGLFSFFFPVPFQPKYGSTLQKASDAFWQVLPRSLLREFFAARLET
jgi:hypothetical protein